MDFSFWVLSVPVLWNVPSACACRSENDKKVSQSGHFLLSPSLLGGTGLEGQTFSPKHFYVSLGLILLTCFLWSCLSEIFMQTLGSVTPLVLEKPDAESERLGNV